MQQILFEIPLPFGGWTLPIRSWGAMLAVAFILCPWLAARRIAKEGINPQILYDLAVYFFIGGLFGGRFFYMVIEAPPEQSWATFFNVWDGGMVLYGALLGGLASYGLAYFRMIRPQKISTLRLADVIAPSIGVGLMLGRIGCFFSGCCYGNVADPAQVFWGVHFPANSAPFRDIAGRGHQLAYGFALSEPPGQAAKPLPPTVRGVDSHAAAAGLRTGDRILKVWDSKDEEWIGEDNTWVARAPDGREVRVPALWNSLLHLNIWQPGEPMHLAVDHGDGKESLIAIPPPRSLPLHPTQLYSSFDGLILFLLLSAYYPFRRRAGEVMALFMVSYAITRFLIEGLRIDNPEYLFGLTFSQNISILLFVSGLVFWLWLIKPGPRTLA